MAEATDSKSVQSPFESGDRHNVRPTVTREPENGTADSGKLQPSQKTPASYGSGTDKRSGKPLGRTCPPGHLFMLHHIVARTYTSRNHNQKVHVPGICPNWLSER